MNKFEKIQPLPDDLWSHDKLITDERAAAVRDPLVVIAQSGRRMVPATFEFRSSPGGDRSSPLFAAVALKIKTVSICSPKPYYEIENYGMGIKITKLGKYNPLYSTKIKNLTPRVFL